MCINVWWETKIMIMFYIENQRTTNTEWKSSRIDKDQQFNISNDFHRNY